MTRLSAVHPPTFVKNLGLRFCPLNPMRIKLSCFLFFVSLPHTLHHTHTHTHTHTHLYTHSLKVGLFPFVLNYTTLLYLSPSLPTLNKPSLQNTTTFFCAAPS